VGVLADSVSMALHWLVPNILSEHRVRLLDGGVDWNHRGSVGGDRDWDGGVVVGRVGQRVDVGCGWEVKRSGVQSGESKRSCFQSGEFQRNGFQSGECKRSWEMWEGVN